ncbi:hypothetical protein ACFYWF_32440 [Streptomyces sp. NPDC003344]
MDWMTRVVSYSEHPRVGEEHTGDMAKATLKDGTPPRRRGAEHSGIC